MAFLTLVACTHRKHMYAYRQRITIYAGSSTFLQLLLTFGKQCRFTSSMFKLIMLQFIGGLVNDANTADDIIY